MKKLILSSLTFLFAASVYSQTLYNDLYNYEIMSNFDVSSINLEVIKDAETRLSQVYQDSVQEFVLSAETDTSGNIYLSFEPNYFQVWYNAEGKWLQTSYIEPNNPNNEQIINEVLTKNGLKLNPVLNGTGKATIWAFSIGTDIWYEIDVLKINGGWDGYRLFLDSSFNFVKIQAYQ